MTYLPGRNTSVWGLPRVWTVFFFVIVVWFVEGASSASAPPRALWRREDRSWSGLRVLPSALRGSHKQLSWRALVLATVDCLAHRVPSLLIGVSAERLHIFVGFRENLVRFLAHLWTVPRGVASGSLYPEFSSVRQAVAGSAVRSKLRWQEPPDGIWEKRKCWSVLLWWHFCFRQPHQARWRRR